MSEEEINAIVEALLDDFWDVDDPIFYSFEDEDDISIRTEPHSIWGMD